MPDSPGLRIAAAIVFVAGCGDTARHSGGDGSGSGPADLTASFVDDGGVWTGPCDDGEHQCKDGLKCVNGACVADNGTCQSDDDCENDTWCNCVGGGGGDGGPCVGGVCVAWGTDPRGTYDPDCASEGFTPAQFVAPKLKCSWTGAGVMSSTLVADLDGDHKPEIVAQTLNNTLVALHGKDCSVMFENKFNFGSSDGHIAVADLDADGKPEIVAMGGAGVTVFDNKGQVLAVAPSKFDGRFGFGGPSIADVDNKAPPEIIAGGQVLRYVKGQNQLTLLWSMNPSAPYADGLIPIAADLDGDKKPEVIQGRTVYDGITGNDKTPPGLKAIGGAGAFSAIGDLNGDKLPDIVMVQNFGGPVSVSVYDFAHDKVMFGPFPFAGDRMGPPTIADFDGDGKPDFAAAGADAYRVFSLRCVGGKRLPQCDKNEEGVLWKKLTQDKSSGVTGSSVFDFNGDGKAEVVYRDECWLRVYHGPDGKTLFAAPVTSFTALELPVVADVDGDGHADIVIGADSTQKVCPGTPEADTNTPFAGYVSGIFVYQDPKNRWMPSRAVWNEHGYHITNVNDDLTVPVIEKNNWLTLNNYRQNVQGSGAKPLAVGDATGGAATGIDPGQTDCSVAWTLRANLCNRGAADLQAGVPGTFYQSDPRIGNPAPICTAVSTMVITPGECELLGCDWPNPPQAPTDLWFRGDDDGKGGKPVRECKQNNDLLLIPKAVCHTVG